MAQSTKQKFFQDQVNAVDPALAALDKPEVAAAIDACRVAAAAVDIDFAPAARAYLANFANMQSSIDSLRVERERLNSAANPPEAAKAA